MVIYMVTNNINSKKYIGQTTNTLSHRKKQHKYDAKSRRRDSYFYNAINKYGWDNFSWEVIWEGIDILEDLELLDRMERRFMNEYKPEYNLRAGGQNGYRHSEETKEKMRLFMLGKRCITYMITTPKGNIIEVNKLDEYCEANNLNYNSLTRIANGWAILHKGYTIEHTNEKMRLNALLNAENRNQPTGINLRNCSEHTLEKDGQIYVFDHIQNFSNEHNLSKGAVGWVLKGKRKQHKGWTLPNS